MPTTTTGIAPVGLASSSSAALQITPGAWVADVSQAATFIIDTVPGVALISPPLATAPAWIVDHALPLGGDPIDPLTVDADGRVHSDGT